MKMLIVAMGIVVAFFVGVFLFYQSPKETGEEKTGTVAEEVSSVSDEGEVLPPEVPDALGKSPEGNEEGLPQSEGSDGEEEISAAVATSATIKTEKGDIVLALYGDAAPKTVENFVKLARSGFYNGLKFHRVVPGFVIQGGDPLSRDDDPRVGSGGPGYTFEDEINPRSLGLTDGEIAELASQGYVYDYTLESHPMDVGVLAMANSGPNTNGSQFFIVLESAQPHLNGKHTVFGRVTLGMEVVRAIEQGDVITTVKVNAR